jgi:tRNA modification GTPase
MPSFSEPVCALITPPGYGAINVLRISGSGAVGIVAQLFKPRRKLLNSPSHRVIRGTVFTATGEPLDEVLCTVFRAPHSYTGEDCVEISCHGNPHLASRILENLLLSTRHARPGEFTLRALLNGKLDLTQAEAVNDLITARSEMAENAALMQVQGVLSGHLNQLLAGISDARLRCELAIDFADQDLPQIDLDDLRTRVSSLLETARALHSEGSRGRFIRDGLRICLAGAPNSGKSSLFNAFLKANRAIVTPHPGTTRDYLEESVSLRGYTLVLYDTAGIRDTGDEIERAGIGHSLQLMKDSDLILWLADASNQSGCPLPELEPDLAGKTLWLLSKADLLPDFGVQPADDDFNSSGQPNAGSEDFGVQPANDDLNTIRQPHAGMDFKQQGPPNTAASLIPVSVIAPGGLDRLYDAILDRFRLPGGILNRPLVTNTRHLAALRRCLASLEGALLALDNRAGFEFIAFDLISASHALEEILGLISTEDLLDRIFSEFCIGK